MLLYMYALHVMLRLSACNQRKHKLSVHGNDLKKWNYNRQVSQTSAYKQLQQRLHFTIRDGL